jgi:hypothetical protein
VRAHRPGLPLLRANALCRPDGPLAGRRQENRRKQGSDSSPRAVSRGAPGLPRLRIACSPINWILASASPTWTPPFGRFRASGHRGAGACIRGQACALVGATGTVASTAVGAFSERHSWARIHQEPTAARGAGHRPESRQRGCGFAGHCGCLQVGQARTAGGWTETAAWSLTTGRVSADRPDSLSRHISSRVAGRSVPGERGTQCDRL